MSGKAREPFPARGEAKAAAEMRTHPSLALKLQSIPYLRLLLGVGKGNAVDANIVF